MITWAVLYERITCFFLICRIINRHNKTTGNTVYFWYKECVIYTGFGNVWRLSKWVTNWRPTFKIPICWLHKQTVPSGKKKHSKSWNICLKLYFKVIGLAISKVWLTLRASTARLAHCRQWTLRKPTSWHPNVKITLFKTYRTLNTCKKITCTISPPFIKSELTLFIYSSGC